MTRAEHIDMTNNWIENDIVWIADRLDQLPEADIVRALQEAGLGSDNIFLLMRAAKLLHQERTNALPKKL